jgi:hypothetical protein
MAVRGDSPQPGRRLAPVGFSTTIPSLAAREVRRAAVLGRLDALVEVAGAAHIDEVLIADSRRRRAP